MSGGAPKPRLRHAAAARAAACSWPVLRGQWDGPRGGECACEPGQIVRSACCEHARSAGPTAESGPFMLQRVEHAERPTLPRSGSCASAAMSPSALAADAATDVLRHRHGFGRFVVLAEHVA
jgi:hypothetical protein